MSKTHKVIENEYQLIGYVQTALSNFIKQHGEYKADDASDDEMKHTGTYIMRLLNFPPPVRFDGLYVVALMMDEYKERNGSITLVLDDDLRTWAGDFKRGIGHIRKVFSCLDFDAQIALTQQVIGAYSLHEIINDL